MEAILGLILIAGGGMALYRGLHLKEDQNSMSGLKFRMLLTGAGAIFIGLIILFR